MCQTRVSVWFVCKLCRGCFEQVDAFIEHKKEKHFTEFQNTSCLVFEEMEEGELCPIISKAEHQLADENNEPPIKTEVNDEDPTIPFSSEIIDEPTFDLVEPKSELLSTYESEKNPGNENIFFDLEQPVQNPYVLLKRLTSEEIQRACIPQHHQSTLAKYEEKKLENSIEHINAINNCEDKKSTEIPRSERPVECDLELECKLCLKQLESDAQLKIHVGICALYHKDQSRFCVICNRKFHDTTKSKYHRLRFHGTEEERLSLYKFKCHICLKQYRESTHLRFHLESHKKKKHQVETSKSKPYKCSQPNCGKEFRCNSELQSHTGNHFGVRPFSCSFPNCNKKFTQRCHLNLHFRIHTGERPYKCTVVNCNQLFTTSHKRSTHHRNVHCQ